MSRANLSSSSPYSIGVQPEPEIEQSGAKITQFTKKFTTAALEVQSKTAEESFESNNSMEENKQSAVEPTVGSGGQIPPDQAKSNVTGGGDTPIEKPYDPFSEEDFRRDQSRQRGAATRHDTSFTIRKPRPNSFFRVHPEFSYTTHVYIDKGEDGLEKDVYLLTPRFAEDELPDDFLGPMRRTCHYLAKERHADKAFIWKIGIPDIGARDNEYNRTAREIADMARAQWLRIQLGVGSWDYYIPKFEILEEPVWPNLPFREILSLAYKGRVINSMDHPVMRALAGDK